MNLIKLYQIKNRLIKENMQNDSFYNDILNLIKEKESQILEDGGDAVGSVGVDLSNGMGPVISAQPSVIAGSTTGANWMNGGGTIGSGDIGVPYNPSGNNRVFQKISSPMGKSHGGRTGKKSRNKKMGIKDLQNLKKTLANRDNFTQAYSDENKPKKVMSFDDFSKDDMNKVTKVKE